MLRVARLEADASDANHVPWTRKEAKPGNFTKLDRAEYEPGRASGQGGGDAPPGFGLYSALQDSIVRAKQ